MTQPPPQANRLEKVQAYSTIFASIAVPILIAFFGWVIQVRQSETGARTEYVQMAIGILMDPKRNSEDDLRQWAVALLDETSPVPFTKELRQDLSTGKVRLSPLTSSNIPAILMEPPKPLISLKEGQNTFGDTTLNLIENVGICRENSVRLEHLQNLLRNYGNYGDTLPIP